MTISILQFGTSRFLQAHADLFVGQARAQGQSVGQIAVIQTTDSQQSRKRVDAFKQLDCYQVAIRGVRDGVIVDEVCHSDSIATGYHASSEWDRILSVARDADLIFSNTGDGSYAVVSSDQFDEGVPESYPAKLLAVLHARYRAEGAPPIILPCELKPAGNGTTLKNLVTALATSKKLDQNFVDWLADGCIWGVTLVDRMVAGDLEPVGAIAEPFALWAIGQQSGLSLPFSHSAVQVTDRLEDHIRLKIYLLNVAHMVLVARWNADGRRYDYCRQAMSEPKIRAYLVRVYEEELLPSFQKSGMEKMARDYVDQTIERFENPFLDHAFKKMIVDYPNKVRQRIGGFLDWSDQLGVAPHQAVLRRHLDENS